MKDRRVGFIGAGNMAEALIAGLLAAKLAEPGNIIASDPRAARREDLSARLGIQVTGENAGVAARADVLFLAVKPQVAPEVLAELGAAIGGRHLLLSIVAGLGVATIEAALAPGTRVVRTMPNTPSLVRAGVTALAAGTAATAEDVTVAEHLFGAVGRTLVVKEGALDAVTGLSGSGPGYALLVIEALADAGVRVGLPRDASLLLAAQTMLGTARLLLETGDHPARLRDAVTSPGGTTAAGLAVLESRAV
ncbi:MAG: pyrroline-5-carboxylate reductase, partial [Deltaproteobacteria bacterium]|nr:pyrroline-5-carboxylate reductase [Deltaproteobacteria bacterium]